MSAELLSPAFELGDETFSEATGLILSEMQFSHHLMNRLFNHSIERHILVGVGAILETESAVLPAVRLIPHRP